MSRLRALDYMLHLPFLALATESTEREVSRAYFGRTRPAYHHKKHHKPNRRRHASRKAKIKSKR